MNVAMNFDVLDKMFKDNNEKLDLWVCAYIQNGVLKEARRNVKPTKVKVSYSKEHLEGKRTHARNRYIMTAYKKDGVSLSVKEISIFGNRGGSEEALQFFINEQECNNKYNEQLFNAIKRIEMEKEKVIKDIDYKIEKLKNDFVGSDFTMETLFRS